MARTNRTCSYKLLIKVISNSKGSSKPAKDERKINKNQGRHIECHYRRGFGLWDKHQLHICCNDRRLKNLYWSKWSLSCDFQQRKHIHHGLIWVWWQCHIGRTNKKQNSAIITESFSSYGEKLTARGLQPQLMMLDNEASQLLKSYLHDKNITLQLVPPYSHRINAGERAIRSFKDHLIAGIFSTYKEFPMYLWDRLLPQAVIT
jgi:hypothetical protein